MKEQNLLLSQIEEEGLTILPNVSFDDIRKSLDALEKKTKYFEEALEKERKVNINERYEKEISYLHKQLSYCPLRLNEKQYNKYSSFLKTHSKCGPIDDFHYAIYFTPTPLGMAADLECKRCKEWIELIGAENW